MQEPCETKLFEVIGALHAAGRLASLLYRRQEQGHENADDRNNDQQFDKGKGTFPIVTAA